MENLLTMELKRETFMICVSPQLAITEYPYLKIDSITEQTTQKLGLEIKTTRNQRVLRLSLDEARELVKLLEFIFNQPEYVSDNAPPLSTQSLELAQDG